MNILTQQQVKDAFSKAGVGNPNLTLNTIDDVMSKVRAESFAMVEEEWIINEFVPWFNSLLTAWGITWQTFFVCQGFAQLFCALMLVAYLRRCQQLNLPAAQVAASIACFQSWGNNYPGVTGEHAVVAAITENGAVWIEPQQDPSVKIYPMLAVNAAAVDNIE